LPLAYHLGFMALFAYVFIGLLARGDSYGGSTNWTLYWIVGVIFFVPTLVGIFVALEDLPPDSTIRQQLTVVFPAITVAGLALTLFADRWGEASMLVLLGINIVLLLGFSWTIRMLARRNRSHDA